MDGFLFHIHRGMLEFVGFEVLDPVITCGPARMTERERAAALDSVRESVARIAATAPATARRVDESRLPPRFRHG